MLAKSFPHGESVDIKGENVMKNENKKFSIIIPVYNVASYVRECLDSVLDQSFINWEAICVDDGSTDGSGEILDDYAKNDSRLRVIHQLNAGVSAARNVGLDLAQGEYVLFVDGDDLIHPRILEYLIDIFDCQSADGVRYGWSREDPRNVGWLDFSNRLARVYSLKDDEELQSAMRFFFGGSACTVCYRRAALAKARFECLRNGEDHLFTSTVFGFLEIVAVFDASLYFYRIRKDSATHVVSEESFNDLMIALRKIYEYSLDWPFRDKIRKRVYAYIWRAFAQYAYLLVCGSSESCRAIREKRLIKTIIQLYQEEDFAPNRLIRTFRLVTLHLGPLTWTVGVNMLMNKMFVSKSILYKWFCRIRGGK